jgi:ubiquitin-activating enzyme E1
MDNFLDTNIKFYEIYIGNVVIDDKKKQSGISSNISKIIPIKYINETGNLNLNIVKKNKYYNVNHPISTVRDNPIFEFPSNIPFRRIKDMIVSEQIPFKNLLNNQEIPNDEIIEKIEKYSDSNNITDIYYEVSSLRNLKVDSNNLNSIKDERESNIDYELMDYAPNLPIFKEFEKLQGIKNIISVLKSTVQKWTNKEAIDFWIKWTNDLEIFCQLPSFFASLISHQQCSSILFNLLCGFYDNENSAKKEGHDVSKYIFEILGNTFSKNRSGELRKIAIEKGIFNCIIERLELLTHEKPRKFSPGEEKEEENKKNEENKKKENTNTTNKKISKKGVGYGSDQTGDNKTWDVTQYLAGKKSNSLQIASIIKLLTDFFDTNDMKIDDKTLKVFLESSIIPCLESAYRGGTLLELAKEAQLYYAYLDMTIKLSKNPLLIPLLLDISKDYKPVQTQSVYTLLSLLNDGTKIFANALKHESAETGKIKSTEEQLANEIMRTFDIVTAHIKSYQIHLDNKKNYSEILKLPVEKSYPLLLRELAFDYMKMRNSSGKLEHYYANNISGNPTSTKSIRLAQEFADLPRSLPIESTNSIYVRVDKDNMDFMKVLIMGSEGTPYSNGAFQFDVFFDSQYPNLPPKVTIMTTGNGTTRFNPNLYSNGKVCLSLLGTWRGQSTENWDPKISTLLQVLISIQGIIMSDLVYFNEPSCESEMGTPQGEAKNEAYSNIVRYSNIKWAMIEQIKKPSPGFEEVIKRHFYLKKEQILKEVKGWIERSKTAEAKYSSFSLEHNPNLAAKMSKPGAYTQMITDIYYELEKTLKSLTLPIELMKKTEDEEYEKQKKIEKITFENIDNVDMTYDSKDKENKKLENKELNLNDDAVKDRWSRYIGAMGMEAVQRQANSSIFLSGAGGLGIEIAKNLVLSGCKMFVLNDTKLTTYYDLSSQFFLSESDIGKNRAECSVKKLQELNYYVKVLPSTQKLTNNEKEIDVILNNFEVVILTECNNDIIIAVDNYCRKSNKKFICCDIFGSVGRLINDFGNEFIVNDKDGEDEKEVMVKNIESKKDDEALLTVLDGTRHDFVDDDIVEVNEVVGLDGINKKKFKVKVLTPGTFNLLGDFKEFKDKKYERNGICRQVKQQKKINFIPVETLININSNDYESITEKYTDPNMLISDFTKMKNCSLINLAMTTINNLKSLYGEQISPWSIKFSDFVINSMKKNKTKPFTEEELKSLYFISFTHMVQFPPLCAYLGGFASQEAIKAITNKYTPVNQMMFYDLLELSPELDIKSENIEKSIKQFNYEPKNNRTDGLQLILGKETLEKLLNMKILVVGAGAIGCELLKNFSMLNIGTGENGSIYVTDPDIIEVSNLNRQFLFREKHLRLPKSSTAAAAIIQMNPLLKNHIFAKIDKLCEETENIFSDTFFSSLSLVANALDNVNARRYVDSRCVSSRKPLLESGTLGPKGHVQVIIPFKTESYSSQNDPEVSNDIPQCTLKMFPEEAIHCVEWARDQFGKIFTQLPKTINKIIEEVKGGNVSFDEIKLVKKTLKWIKKRPKTFEDCLIIAREKFNKVFVNNIKQLLYVYPLDKKDKSGKLFWSLPKRPPIIYDFKIDDELCIDFISAYSCLMANMFGIKIPYDKPRDKQNKIDMCSKVKDTKVEDFKPNEEKLKEIEKEVEESENKKIEEEKKENEKNEILTTDKDELLIKELTEIISKKDFTLKLNSTEFEKDNDSNFHIDIIYSMSALRCKNYKLEIMDWMTVKIKAGRIIPALATTTSSIAALQSIELVKIAKDVKFENYRNSFLNLAIPYLQSAEPGVCKKNIIHEGLSSTLWDRWEINLDKDKCNIKSLFDILKSKYLLYPRDIFKGKKAIYSYMGYKDKKELNEEIVNRNLKELLGISKSDDSYCDLMITFTKNENDDIYLKDIPIVRVYFQK